MFREVEGEGGGARGRSPAKMHGGKLEEKGKK